MKTPVEHPNTMIIEVFDKDTKIAKHTFVSIGGGKIEIDGKKGNVDPEIYHTQRWMIFKSIVMNVIYV